MPSLLRAPVLTLFLTLTACVVEPADTDEPGALGKGDGTGSDVLGAVPVGDGVAFGVWAPNAERVYVTGSFSSWDDTAYPLAPGGGGVWTGTVAGAAAGDEYQFVIERAGRRVRRADPRARQMTSSAGNSVVYDPRAYTWSTAPYRTPSFDEAVVYELHVGTFDDAPGGAPGTWRRATGRLDHLASLGVNMIEILPPAEFAGDFSWGYNGAYPFAPEHAYGSPDDLKRFIDAAHQRGMGVIIDVVHNHYGPSDLSMWCFDLECYGGGNGGVYFYTDWRRETGWGPRPDFGRAEVRDFIAANVEMWLHEYRADGLRWDSTVNIRRAGGADLADGRDVLTRANRAVDATQPWKLMIAEDLQGDRWLTEPTSAGGAGFDSQWDAGFFHPVDRNLIEPDDARRSMAEIRDAITARYGGRALARVIYTESHDEVANGKSRIPEMIYPGHADSYWSKKRSTLGAALVLTAPGIPMIFQGQEMLEDGYFRDDDPLDWAKLTRFPGIVQMYRDLIALRRDRAGATRGLRGDHVNVFHVNDTDKVIAFHRWDQGGAGDDVVVVLNFSSRAFPRYDLGMPRGGTWRVRFNGDWQGYDPGFDGTASDDTSADAGGRDGLGYHATIGIGPYSAVILSQ